MPDFRAKMHQKSISAGALPQTLLGELTALPQLDLGALLLREGKGKGSGKEGRGGEGSEGKEGGKGKRRTTAIPNFLGPAFEGQNLSAKQISSTYLNPRLIYNYFPFGKTNDRHIGILHLAILTRSH